MSVPGRKTSFTLSRDELRALSAHAVTRTFAKNTVIVSEGDPADSLYVIVSGKVKAFVADGDGREVVLSAQGPGEYFGEMMLDEGPRSASMFQIAKDVKFKPDWARRAGSWPK